VIAISRMLVNARTRLGENNDGSTAFKAASNTVNSKGRGRQAVDKDVPVRVVALELGRIELKSNRMMR
jgi:hypothetical protein